MTLVLTEVSNAGIAMAADSAITLFRPDGSIANSDRIQWTKLLRAPRINAGVSYWGAIGNVIARRFDEWLRDQIANGQYNDLPGLALHLANAMNVARGNVPLGPNKAVGVHVAGYHEWADNVRRPTFFHVHNGHGGINYGGVVQVGTYVINGKAIPRLVPTNPAWVWQQPRTNFTVHQDFPSPARTVQQNLAALASGYLTRNGDIGHYLLIGEALNHAAISVNQIPGVRMPSNPNDVRPRLNFLVTQIQTTAAFYRCSNLSRIIGGNISGLGIRQDGSHSAMHRSASRV